MRVREGTRKRRVKKEKHKRAHVLINRFDLSLWKGAWKRRKGWSAEWFLLSTKGVTCPVSHSCVLVFSPSLPPFSFFLSNPPPPKTPPCFYFSRTQRHTLIPCSVYSSLYLFLFAYYLCLALSQSMSNTHLKSSDILKLV